MSINERRRSFRRWLGTAALLASALLAAPQVQAQCLTRVAFPPLVDTDFLGAGLPRIADFNGDGKQDVARLGFSGFFGGVGTLEVLLGNGDGTVQSAITTAMASPRNVAVGEFNGDGKPDLVFVAATAVTVYLAVGDGTFQAPVSYPAGTNLQQAALGDLNGDGKADLAVADAANPGGVAVLLGIGDGRFQPPVSHPSGASQPTFVVMADVNRDGKLDLAVAHSFAAKAVTVLLGLGDGTFQAPTTAATYVSVGPGALAAGDLDLDGNVDLAVTAVNSPNTISVLIGEGDGTFAPSANLGPTGNTSNTPPAIGDFNGDGNPDLAVHGATGGLDVLFGRGDGTFTSPVRLTADSSGEIQAGNVNGDGRLDFVDTYAAYVNGCTGSRADLSITKTDGQSVAVPGTTVTYTITAANAGPSATSAVVADVFPGAITGPITWSCTASAGSSCQSANGAGNVNQTVSLAAGGTATFVASGMIDAGATGTLSNTATITASPALGDDDYANNTATDTDVLGTPVDLSISKTDGQSTASPGQPVSYTIVVSNAGQLGVTSATVTDTPPSALVSPAWSCVGAGGGTCTASGTGAINDTVNVPVGATVTYTLSGMVSGSPASLRNTATVTAPAGTGDSNPSDNTATDEDLLSCGGETSVVADGRLSEGVIGAGATRWFGSTLRLGDSYSVEVANPMDAVSPGTLAVFAGADGCTGTSTLATRDTNAIEPATGPSGRRLSFTAIGADPFVRLRLVNASGASLPYAFAVADTTLFSTTWNTSGTYNTYLAFQNTTSALLRGTLTLVDTGGAVVSVAALVIPADGKLSTNTVALGSARNTKGSVRFSHDGPPGAVVAEAVIANFSFPKPYVQPVQFIAVREER